MPISQPLVKPYKIAIYQVGVIQRTIAGSFGPALVVRVPRLGNTSAELRVYSIVSCVDAPVVVRKNGGGVEEIVAHEEYIKAQIYCND